MDREVASLLTPPARLTRQELQRRASALRLVLTDVDGVLTDAGVYYSAEGEAMKRFNVRDGMGVELLRERGIITAFLTRERSPIVAHRAEKLRMHLYYMGIHDKRAHLPQIARDTGFSLSELAYIGDDVNDLGVLEAVAERGLTAAPNDAHPSVLPLAHHRCKANGGYGAFREFADWLLELRR
ncbi:KdsC family phosphatase [Pendulispora albinea]|uniref:3-deoxy-D-manno-octulosonate 8-phosphate phosphatase n=1 Tax=Pendulispora albinea TaxID=2741071 RepID=A0ABZ2M7V9_9BACT